MTQQIDVVAVGNAIVDVIAPASDAFLEAEDLAKGVMTLIDEAQAERLYARMAPGVEASGGSAANTVAGVASFGGRAAYVGKVADDGLGRVFRHDITAGGVAFASSPLRGGPATARCLINVTPDGQRTMCTYLGASTALTPEDVDPDLIAAGRILYLEGYLFDAPGAREAFVVAATAARRAGRRIALSLSDPFVVDRHREALIPFIRDQIDLLFANEAEALGLAQTASLAEALDVLSGLAAVAAVTRGPEGSVVAAGPDRLRVPAVRAERVIDTTGAGDQYAAGFLFGLARGLDIEAAARLGHLAAGEVVGHYGPRPQTSLAALAALDA